MLDHFVIVQVDPPKPETIQEGLDRALSEMMGQPITETTMVYLEWQIQNILNAALMRGEIESVPRALAISMPNFQRVEVVTRPTSEHEALALWTDLKARLSEPEQADAIHSLCRRVPEFFSSETSWLHREDVV